LSITLATSNIDTLLSIWFFTKARYRCNNWQEKQLFSENMASVHEVWIVGYCGPEGVHPWWRKLGWHDTNFTFPKIQYFSILRLLFLCSYCCNNLRHGRLEHHQNICHTHRGRNETVLNDHA